MKKAITIIVAVAVVLIGFSLNAQDKRYAMAKYSPVADFIPISSTLGQWYKQYMDTTSGEPKFTDFLKKLASSEVLQQMGKRAGIQSNQIYSPIVTLSNKNWKAMDKMSDQELAGIGLAMGELDIALAAIEATIPVTAHEEFRREVIRGAKPLSEVATLPGTATGTMTMMNHRVSDRINNVPAKPGIRNFIWLKPNLPSQPQGVTPWQ